ncbi:MAG: Eco57I restriction-modification methylase domain-containing protein, partial [Bacteroidia bacterium]
QKTLFQEKQTIIENCLFGVDINPNSVKICRLRLWIELLKNAYYKTSVSSSEVEKKELETLPNIDINIKCGNSLISRFALDADLSKALKSIKYDINSYRGFVQSYKNEKSRDAKRGLSKIIDSIKSDFRTEISKQDPIQLKVNKASGELLTLLSQTSLLELSAKDKKEKKEKQNKLEEVITKLNTEIDEIKNNVIYKNAFEWRFEFPEVLSNKGEYLGFDLVIGNPPYIRHEEIKHLKPQLEKDFSVYNSSADLLTYFFELGHKILKDKGELSFIVSNKFFKVSYGEKLRNFIIQNTLVNTIIDFDKLNVFDEATVKAAIVQFSKIKTASNFIYLDVQDMPDNLEKTITAKAKDYEQNLFTGGGQWIFQSEEKWKIFHKISKHGVALSDWDLKIYRGLLTGLNEAFLIDEATKNNLIKEDKSAANLIKPLFRGREIEKYNAEFQKTYLIFIPKGYTIKRNLPKNSPHFVEEPSPRYGNMEFDDAWNWMEMNYPSIAKHLLSFKLNAEKRQDKGDYWWELRACDYYKKFEEPKLIWKRIGSKLRFCYDESGTYTLDSTCIATGSHLKYLVGVLNSKLIDNELNRFAPKTGTGDLIISVQALSPLQIPIPTEKQEMEMIKLVDKIILQKQQNQDTKKLEAEIDQMVY